MRMRLAIIDDELTVCRELSRTLTAEGFEVESFQSGQRFLGRKFRMNQKYFWKLQNNFMYRKSNSFVPFMIPQRFLNDFPTARRSISHISGRLF